MQLVNGFSITHHFHLDLELDFCNTCVYRSANGVIFSH